MREALQKKSAGVAKFSWQLTPLRQSQQECAFPSSKSEHPLVPPEACMKEAEYIWLHHRDSSNSLAEQIMTPAKKVGGPLYRQWRCQPSDRSQLQKHSPGAQRSVRHVTCTRRQLPQRAPYPDTWRHVNLHGLEWSSHVPPSNSPLPASLKQALPWPNFRHPEAREALTRWTEKKGGTDMKGAVWGASRGAGPDTASELPGPKEVTCDVRGATSEPAMCAVLAVSILDLSEESYWLLCARRWSSLTPYIQIH